MPGSDDDKLELINCVSCHTLERIVKSTHDADEFVQRDHAHERLCAGEPADQAAAARRPVARLQPGAVPQAGGIPRHHQSEQERRRWSYELKTLPRVKGRGTNVIITEYDLPRQTIEPHDVIVVDGTVWYTNFGEQFLGKLDPKTGKHTEFAMQQFRSRASRTAISTSASTRTAISGSA